MALSKLITLIALLSLAFLACSFVASPVNAISVDSHHYVRRDHAAIANKRSTSTSSTKRCKPRPGPSNSTTTTVSTPKPSPVKSAPPPPKVTSAAAPSSASAQPQPSPSTSSSGNGHKRCLAWSSGDDPALAKWAYGKADKLYTWSAFFPSKTYGLQGMAMLWGPTKLAEFQKLVVQGYATIALGFNEPDVPTQSNMDPAYAAQLWKEHMNPLKDKGYTLVSPATVTGPEWMTNFFKACNGGCHVDVLALHWYGKNHTELRTYLESFHTKFNLNIWLTEVACESFVGDTSPCTAGQVWDLMNALESYESISWFELWCYFGVMHDMTNVSPVNQLMAADGSPNTLGNYFLNA